MNYSQNRVIHCYCARTRRDCRIGNGFGTDSMENWCKLLWEPPWSSYFPRAGILEGFSIHVTTTYEGTWKVKIKSCTTSSYLGVRSKRRDSWLGIDCKISNSWKGMQSISPGKKQGLSCFSILLMLKKYFAKGIIAEASNYFLQTEKDMD